jgi:hypothetical protein
MTYPGQATPSPEVGQANRVAYPTGPTVGHSTHTPQYTPPAVVGTSVHTPLSVNTQAIGRAVRNPNPYNNNVPPIGQGAHTPLLTPLGQSPHFETPTQDWTYDYGNGGGY